MDCIKNEHLIRVQAKLWLNLLIQDKNLWSVLYYIDTNHNSQSEISIQKSCHQYQPIRTDYVLCKIFDIHKG